MRCLPMVLWRQRKSSTKLVSRILQARLPVKGGFEARREIVAQHLFQNLTKRIGSYEAIVLANLLPGIRELRAPLACGYLWLITLWIIFFPRLPQSGDQAKGGLGSLYELGSAITNVGVGVAISFAAYVVGLLSNGLSAPRR
jgi:hypothetical protein